MKNLANPGIEKQKLRKASALYKKEMEDEIKSISKATEKFFTNALIIGGALALTYLAVTQLTGAKSKKKKSRPKKDDTEEGADDNPGPSSQSVLSRVGGILATQATLALLGLAKEKLTEYLESRKGDDEGS